MPHGSILSDEKSDSWNDINLNKKNNPVCKKNIDMPNNL